MHLWTERRTQRERLVGLERRYSKLQVSNLFFLVKFHMVINHRIHKWWYIYTVFGLIVLNRIVVSLNHSNPRRSATQQAPALQTSWISNFIPTNLPHPHIPNPCTPWKFDVDTNKNKNMLWNIYLLLLLEYYAYSFVGTLPEQSLKDYFPFKKAYFQVLC